MKRKILILAAVSLIAAAGLFVFNKRASKQIPTNISVQETKKTGSETSGLQLTDEQKQQYYKVYQEPSVVFLRKALNAYLAGDSGTACILKAAVAENRLMGIVSGLDAFSKDYYRSKFIVATISDNKTVPDIQGKDIQIIFQDKPDRIFYALVGKEPQSREMCLLGFNSKEQINTEEMQREVEFYAPYLFDKNHAL